MQHSGLAGRPLECLLSMRRGKTLTTRVCSRRGIAFALALAALMAASPSALADQGGISFWLPGLFGSLAAVPGQPGVSFTTIYIHPAVEAGGQKNFNLGGQIVAGVDGHANLPAQRLAVSDRVSLESGHKLAICFPWESSCRAMST
jgi:hypothetical protein